MVQLTIRLIIIKHLSLFNKFMEKIVIDLKNVKNDEEIFYRFYKAIGCFYYLSEEEMLKRIEDNDTANWMAFSDNISGIDVKKNGEEIKELLFVIINFMDVEKISKDSLRLLLKVLAQRSDIKQRVDGKNVYLQFHLEN